MRVTAPVTAFCFSRVALNAPNAGNDSALRGVRAAAEMQEALASLMTGLLTVYTGRDGPASPVAGSRGKRPVGAHADDRGRAPGPLPRGAS